jgi:argininosuccinate lyase
MEVLRKAFKQPLDPLVTRFVSSVEDDKALLEADLKGSLAHVEMLIKCGLVSADQGSEIKTGLNKLIEQAKAGQLELKVEHEDVHTNFYRAKYRTISRNVNWSTKGFTR